MNSPLKRPKQPVQINIPDSTFFSTWYSPAYVHEMGQGKADQEVFCEAGEIG